MYFSLFPSLLITKIVHVHVCNRSFFLPNQPVPLVNYIHNEVNNQMFCDFKLTSMVMNCDVTNS